MNPKWWWWCRATLPKFTVQLGAYRLCLVDDHNSINIFFRKISHTADSILNSPIHNSPQPPIWSSPLARNQPGTQNLFFRRQFPMMYKPPPPINPPVWTPHRVRLYTPPPRMDQGPAMVRAQIVDYPRRAKTLFSLFLWPDKGTGSE